MKLVDRFVVALLALWLVVWIVVSWGAVQDDALIHLRYADFLHRVHFITYDGVRPSYGTSSLLYVGLLAALRSLTTSALLSRGVSTAFHILLFTGVAGAYLRSPGAISSRCRLMFLALLLLLVSPSAVRWLDDGMETGLVLCMVSLAAWWTHRLSLRDDVSARDFILCMAMGFALVVLRTELASVALMASGTLAVAAITRSPRASSRVILSSGHFLVGGVVAAILIRLMMHSFLPDTALAKSHGSGAFIPTLRAAATVLTGALLFGLGLLVLWLISAGVVLLQRGARMVPTLAANALFPAILLASSLRGQEIQGARYLVWCFLFSIVWNVLELRRIDRTQPEANRSSGVHFLVAAFLLVCLLVLPVESRLMGRVLVTRAHTMQLFQHHDLASALHGQLGVAGDVGYISYFSQDSICDLAGLVNGRAAAAMSSAERMQACAAERPEFAFVNASQAKALADDLDMQHWLVCGQYDFGNLRVPDRHYLLVAPALADATCRANGLVALPESVALADSTYP